MCCKTLKQLCSQLAAHSVLSMPCESQPPWRWNADMNCDITSSILSQAVRATSLRHMSSYVTYHIFTTSEAAQKRLSSGSSHDSLRVIPLSDFQSRGASFRIDSDRLTITRDSNSITYICFTAVMVNPTTKTHVILNCRMNYVTTAFLHHVFDPWAKPARFALNKYW